jgi:hypothetical protein
MNSTGSEVKMTASTWSESDTATAKRIWADYQERHDLSTCAGKTAGIDPRTGRVWIGESIQDVLSQRDADAVDSLLFFERIGSRTYYRKGGLSRTMNTSG